MQLGVIDNGSLPYPFVVHSTGETFGFVDHGQVIGFLRNPEDRHIAMYWNEARQDPSRTVGMWMVSACRFTGAWSTWHGPVEKVSPAPPRSQRTALYGGDQSDQGIDAERLARRALANTTVEDDDDREFALSFSDDTEITVDAARQVRSEEGRIGLLEEFCRADGTIVGWEEFLSNPALAEGATPVVWETDTAHVRCGVTVEVYSL